MLFLRLVSILLPLALSGCLYLSHPFADDRPPPGAPILTVKDSVGVIVAPVAGAPDPTAQALAEAMAAALREADVPAFTGAGNRHSYTLNGEAAAAPLTGNLDRLRIHWTVRDYTGTEIGHLDQEATVPATDWTGGGNLHDLAKSEVAAVAAFVVEPPPAEHKPRQQLYVRAVTGAPGDGGRALPSALAYLLKQRGVAVATDQSQPGTVTVAGTVAVTPVEGQNLDHVQIAWHVLEPDGMDAGQIAQENSVPHGSLDGKWGQVAMAVALAGVDDILRVVTTIPPVTE